MNIALQAYLKGSIEAVAFYKKAFGARLGFNVKNPDGTFMHAELNVDGKALLALSEADNHYDVENRTKYTPTSYPSMNFCVIYQDEEPVKRAYEILKEDANILLPLGSLPWSSCCANLIDKFGIFWYIAVHAQNEPEQ